MSKERTDFVKKQKEVVKEGWMEGKMFMPDNGICYYCNYDVIRHEINKGNDGSELVTGCRKCNRSYCD